MLASHGRAEAPTPPRMRRHAHSTPPVDSGFMREVTETLSDSQLVQRCRAGDPEAWNELVERFSRYVYAICVQGFRLREAVTTLSESCQEVLDRFFARDESYRTISAELDLPAGTIASRISRCLVQLRAELEGRKASTPP